MTECLKVPDLVTTEFKLNLAVYLYYVNFITESIDGQLCFFGQFRRSDGHISIGFVLWIDSEVVAHC